MEFDHPASILYVDGPLVNFFSEVKIRQGTQNVSMSGGGSVERHLPATSAIRRPTPAKQQQTTGKNSKINRIIKINEINRLPVVSER